LKKAGVVAPVFFVNAIVIVDGSHRIPPSGEK
jgi:hypothetical protein